MKDVVTSDEYKQVYQLCKAGQYRDAYNLAVAVMSAPKGPPPSPRVRARRATMSAAGM